MNKIAKYSISFLAILFALLFVGFNISLLAKQSIRLDESQSIWYATKSLPALLEITAQDVHVPLYFTILHIWLKLFGPTIFAARFLSGVFFLATLPVLFLLAKRYSDIKTSVFTVLLFMFSPFVLWYSIEARMYSQFMFVSILNVYSYLYLLDSDAKHGKVFYFLSLIAGLFTHYYFVFQVFVQVVYSAIIILHNKNDLSLKTLKNALISKLSLSLFLVWGVSASIFSLWIYYFLSSGYGQNTSPNIATPAAYNLLQTYANFFVGFQDTTIQSIIVSLWPLAVLAIFLGFSIKSKTTQKYSKFFIASSLVPILMAFAISFVSPIYLSRYLIFTTPLLFFVIAHLVISKNTNKFPLLAVILLFFMGFSLFQQSTSINTPVKENYEGIASFLSGNAKSQDIILTTPPFTAYPIEYSYNGIAKISSIPVWNRYDEGAIPPFSLEDLDRQITNYKNTYQTMYVIFSYDQGYEEDIKKYLGNNYELLGKQEFSANLELYHYKLRYDLAHLD